MWSHFFCQSTPGNFSILVPESWSNFFTVMLLSPVNLTWAREFVVSNAFNYLQDSNGSISFSIPAKCPANGKTLCLKEIVEEQNITGKEKDKMVGLELTEIATAKSTPRKRGNQRDPPISDKEVRRSERFKHKNKGFKSSTCSDRRCISRSPSPPILSTKLIQNLGTQFCKMDPEDLIEEALTKKRKATVIGKKKVIQDQTKKAADGEENSTRVEETSDGGEDMEG